MGARMRGGAGSTPWPQHDPKARQKGIFTDLFAPKPKRKRKKGKAS